MLVHFNDRQNAEIRKKPHTDEVGLLSSSISDLRRGLYVLGYRPIPSRGIGGQCLPHGSLLKMAEALFRWLI